MLVLAGFAVISRVFAFGGGSPQFEVASGLLIAIGVISCCGPPVAHDHAENGVAGRSPS